MPHRDVFAGASSTQLQPARATNYAYARRAAPCGRPTRGLHAREARLHAGFGDRDVRVRHCRGPHQNQELINSADSRMLDRSSPYLTHQRIECKTRTQGPYYQLWGGGAIRIRTRRERLEAPPISNVVLRIKEFSAITLSTVHLLNIDPSQHPRGYRLCL